MNMMFLGVLLTLIHAHIANQMHEIIKTDIDRIIWVLQLDHENGLEL